MTADHAGAASCCFRDIDRIAPRPERYLGAHVLILPTGMRRVASYTTPALLTIHMEEMQIILTVAEVGECIGKLILGDILIMTAEAKVIITRIIGVVKIRREVTHQQSTVLRAMWHMTCRAVTGLHRPMAEFLRAVGNFIAQVYMAGKTEILHGLGKQRLIV